VILRDLQLAAEEYQRAKPFPHAVLDSFLRNPMPYTLTACRKEIDPQAWQYEEHSHSRKKGYISDVTKMPAGYRMLADYLNSSYMLAFLSLLTGIDNLVPDPTFMGGGIHRTTQGGSLGIHADFNLHPQTKLHRRINLLLYTGEWRPNEGGELELWARDMSECVQTIQPLFNRAVIFNIDDTAFHGHPGMLLAEERLSFAAYYYTHDRPAQEKAPFHWALWQNTPTR
jgi:hypothetical protein